MHVNIYFEEYEKISNGTINVGLELVNGLLENGYTVSLIYNKQHWITSKDISILNFQNNFDTLKLPFPQLHLKMSLLPHLRFIRLIVIYIYSLINLALLFLFTPIYFFKFRKKASANIYFSGGWPSGLILRYLLIVNSFFSRMNLFVIHSHPIVYHRFSITMNYYFNKFFGSRCNSLVTISESVNLNLTNIFPSRHINVINNGLTEYYEEEFNGSGEKSKYPIKIGYLGAIYPAKGLHILINSFNIFGNSDYNIIVGGKVQDYQYFVNLTNIFKSNKFDSNIIFLGDMHNIQTFFHNIDVLVVPSTNEAFGMVILEAFKFGVPVICSNAGAFTEIIQHEYNGLLFQSGDLEDLWKNIIRVTSDQNLRNILIFNAMNSIRMKYSTDSMVKKYINLLTDLN